MTGGGDDRTLESARVAATEPAPVHPVYAQQAARFAAMEIDALAALWIRLQHLGLRDRTDEAYAAGQYFERLPHEEPRRAFALALAVLRSDADKSVKMELNDRPLTALIHRHGDALIDEIEAVARREPSLGWALGGLHHWAKGATKARLEAVVDTTAWEADQAAARRPEREIDFAALTVDELARVWIEQKTKPRKDCDDNWFALMDHERDLASRDPERLIDLAVAVLKVETDPNVLGLFAAGPLEDALGHRTIDRIEREAAADQRFARLLGGVYTFSEPDDIKARVEAILTSAGRPG